MKMFDRGRKIFLTGAPSLRLTPGSGDLVGEVLAGAVETGSCDLVRARVGDLSRGGGRSRGASPGGAASLDLGS